MTFDTCLKPDIVFSPLNTSRVLFYLIQPFPANPSCTGEGRNFNQGAGTGEGPATQEMIELEFSA